MSTFIERRGLMRTVLMLIAIIYTPILGGIADVERSIVSTILATVGLVYAVIYDYLHFLKGES